MTPACVLSFIGKKMDTLEVNLPLNSLFFVLTSTVKFAYIDHTHTHAHTQHARHTEYANSQDSRDRG